MAKFAVVLLTVQAAIVCCHEGTFPMAISPSLLDVSGLWLAPSWAQFSAEHNHTGNPLHCLQRAAHNPFGNLFLKPSSLSYPLKAEG